VGDRRRWLLALPLVALAACGEGEPPSEREVGVRVADVAVDAAGNPVVVLQEEDGDRALPIWIGMAEARSIAVRLEHVTPPRPNTHDLAKRLLEGLGARVRRVVVTDLREGTYYGLVVLEGRDGAIEIDSRPSDAIALALRVGAPIFVRDGLFREGAPTGDESPREPGRQVRVPSRDGGPEARAPTAPRRQLIPDFPRLASRSRR
jgi:bifunctional DNase/RNase